MATVEREQVIAALEERRTYILENLQTVTLKKLRVQLEQDLGLEKDALKSHKEVIANFVDAMMVVPAAAEEPAVEEEVEEKPKKKKEKKEKEGKKRKATSSASAPKTAARTYSKKVERMRSICRQATVTIAPNTYVKNKTDAELEAALEELLSKHGLTADAGPNEVAKAKQKLQLARDLEGIDTSNIIEGGRRSRRAASNTTSYKEMMGADSEDEEEEKEKKQKEEAGSDEEEAGSEDEEVVSEAEGSDSEAAEGDEEEEEDEEDDEGTLSDAKSPEAKEAAAAPTPKSEKKEAAPTPKSEKKEAVAAPTPKSEKKADAAAAAAPAGDALADIGNQPKKQRIGDWSDDE